MPTETLRLKIKKPLGTETVSRQSFNDNWDLIDQNAAKREEPEILAEDIFVNGFVVSGMTAAKNGTTATQLDVAAGVCYVKQSVGGLRRYTPSAQNFTTSVASTTYYLDFQPDGTYSWGTAHSSQADYLSITEVTTDASANISTVTDKRNLVPGIGKVNADKLQGKQPSDFISSADGSVLTKHIANKPVYAFPNLLNPAKQTFSRASDAYLKNGEKVPYGVLRTEQGKFGQGAFIEESTTNLLTANQSNVETDTTGLYSINSATLSRDTTEKWEGTASLKIVTPGTTAGEGVYVDITSTANTTYAGSVWVKGSGTINVQLRDDANSVYPAATQVTLTNQWQRVTNVVTVGATSGSLSLVAWTSTAQAITFYVDGLQIEKKAYATSFITGGVTRSADQLSYALDKPLPTKFFGASIFKPEHESSKGQTNFSKTLFWALAGASWRYIVHHQTQLGLIRFSKTADGGTTVYTLDSAAITYNAGDTIFVAWLDDPVTGNMYLWVGINGGTISKYTLANTVQISDVNTIYIGGRDGVGSEINGTIDFPIITDTIPTDEQVEALYRASEWGGLRNYPEAKQDENTVSAFRAYLNTVQSIAAATFTKVAYNIEVFDNQDEYDTTTYRFTAKKAGIYLVTSYLAINSQPDGNRTLLDIYKNGSLQIRLYDNTIGGANNGALGGSAQLKLNAGDYIEIFAYTANALSTSTGITLTFSAIKIA